MTTPEHTPVGQRSNTTCTHLSGTRTETITTQHTTVTARAHTHTATKSTFLHEENTQTASHGDRTGRTDDVVERTGNGGEPGGIPTKT